MLKRWSFLLLLEFGIGLLFFPTRLLAQITQDHPEFCGSHGAASLPSDFTVVTDRSLGRSTLVFSGGEGARVLIPGVMEEAQQVCPLSGGRILIFGEASPSLYNVVLVDTSARQITDSFDAYNPTISPDQHWLIMRKFYPTGGVTANISEEYLLYDLKKDAAENRPPGVSPDDRADVGKVLYPRGQNNLMIGDNIGVPLNQVHEFLSRTFFWAPDSSAVVFADSVNHQLSVVLATIAENGRIATYVHPVRGPDWCGGSASARAMLTSVNFVSGSHVAMQVELTSNEPGCASQLLPLQFRDFASATVEKHERKRGKPAIVDQLQ